MTSKITSRRLRSLIGQLSFFSFQIWHLQKFIFMSITQSKHMRVTRFNPLWVSGHTCPIHTNWARLCLEWNSTRLTEILSRYVKRMWIRLPEVWSWYVKRMWTRYSGRNSTTLHLKEPKIIGYTACYIDNLFHSFYYNYKVKNVSCYTRVLVVGIVTGASS